jgi:hypothetical protein
MQETGFKLKKKDKDSSVKKQKTTIKSSKSGNSTSYNSRATAIITIEKPLEVPTFRCTPSRMIM